MYTYIYIGVYICDTNICTYWYVAIHIYIEKEREEHVHICISVPECVYTYGVTATSRLLKIIGLFCKRDL